MTKTYEQRLKLNYVHVIYTGYEQPLDYGQCLVGKYHERPCDGKLSVKLSANSWSPMEWMKQPLWLTFPVAGYTGN